MPSPDPSAVVIAVCALVSCALTVRALLAVRLGARLARLYPAPERRRAPRTRTYRLGILSWSALAGLLMLLAIHTPLDMLGRLTELGRDFARDHGWYALRRPVQSGLVVVIALAAVALVAFGRQPRGRGPLLAVAATAAYIVIDALSLHAVDVAMAHSLVGATVREVLAMGLIGVAAGCAIASRRWLRAASR